jgi:hypothetical protein
MQRFTATLVGEGSSDQALIPFVEFLLDEYCDIPHVTVFAAGLPSGPLRDRIAMAVDLFPCDMLFIHRDADRTPVEAREREISEAAAASAAGVKSICIVPVRMTEAWLLVDPRAIRRAAGNPSGAVNLSIPSVAKLESIPDPKAVLFEVLERATELGPQRLRRFDRNQARRQVSGFMEDYGVLRQLASFEHLETQVRSHFLKPIA